MIRCLLSAAVALALATTAVAQSVSGVKPSLTLAATAIDDGFAPVADVYAFALTNDSASGLPITAIGLDLQASDLGLSSLIITDGGFLNPSDLGFMDILPEFRGSPITDSFVLMPEGLSALEVNSVFTAEEIVANYTTAGGTLIEPGATTVVAHLSVPTGEVPLVPGGAGALGNVVFSDDSQELILPEPTSALLAGLAAVGFVARRR